MSDKFQSTLLMRGATAWLSTSSRHAKNFNPRSSCEERHGRYRCDIPEQDFNPRSSCEERLSLQVQSVYGQLFQSTLLMRGATARGYLALSTLGISIHAPHARSDLLAVELAFFCQISIHAPHARSDVLYLPPRCRYAYFNPRSSCEERLHRNIHGRILYAFQSTLLMRGAT